MILWNDSLTYASLDYLAKSYASLSGFSIVADHPTSPAKTCVAASVGVLEIPGVPTSNEALIGFYLKLSAAPASFNSLLRFRSAGGSDLVNIQVGPGPLTGTVLFRALTSDGKAELFRSSPVSVVGAWAFIEWKVLFSNNGYIELRVNGVTDNRYENVDTNGSSDLSWAGTRLTPSNGAVQARFSDIYYGDSSGAADLLGRSETVRLIPAKASLWGWGPSKPKKKRLVILAGQSNINGRGALPYTRPRRNPNPWVQTWNFVTQAWEPVAAGIGSSPFYGPPNAYWAFEMSFADRIADLFEMVGDVTESNVYFLRLGADAAGVSNIPPVWVIAGQATWYPDIEYLGVNLSLSNRAFDELIPPAIAALGGWSEIEKVDIVWYQGESEASLLYTFMDQFVDSTNTVFDYFESRIPLPVSWHRIMCQRLGWREGSSKLFPKIDEVRMLQRGNYHFRGNWIETEEYGFRPDGIHMDESGSDRLGLKVFESWLEAQGFTENVKNYFSGTALLADNSYHGVSDLAVDMGLGTISYEQAPELQNNLVNCAVKAVGFKALVESPAHTSSVLAAGLGGVSIPSVVVSSSSPWGFRFSTLDAFQAPETASRALTLSMIG